MQGDLDGASRWYRTAQDLYHDVDPLPLAWLYSQQGIALLRQGRYADARPFFEAADQRLPEYYLASEHLAECEAQLGNLERARRARACQRTGATGNRRDRRDRDVVYGVGDARRRS